MKRKLSYKIRLTAGVRQGGVLSIHLFSVFVDDVLLKLNKSSLGCHIKSLCLNAIMYADDILLMSISVCDLQTMVYLCVTYLEDIDRKLTSQNLYACALVRVETTKFAIS